MMKLILTLGSIAALLGGHCQAAPLQVFILAGQSNMQGHAKISTFEHIGMDPATKSLLDAMTGTDGMPRVCERVWTALRHRRARCRRSDCGVSALPDPREKAKTLAKEQRLNPADERVLTEKIRDESLTERERVILEKGVSNVEFHYLGCAKILGGIGEGLAEAMAGLIGP